MLEMQNNEVISGRVKWTLLCLCLIERFQVLSRCETSPAGGFGRRALVIAVVGFILF
jgi:hypothetical protein